MVNPSSEQHPPAKKAGFPELYFQSQAALRQGEVVSSRVPGPGGFPHKAVVSLASTAGQGRHSQGMDCSGAGSPLPTSRSSADTSYLKNAQPCHYLKGSGHPNG